MRKLNLYLSIMVFICLISGCKKDIPEVEKVKEDFVIAGDTIKNKVMVVNDSIIPDWQQHLQLPIKVDRDTITDLEFYASHDAYQGGTLNRYRSKLKIFKSIELLMDTSLRSNDGKGMKVITPKILDKNDTISRKGVWLTDTIVDLSYYVPTLVFADNTMEIKIVVFNGWNDLGRKYMGYRLLTDKDTTYGWLNLKIEHYNRVYIYMTAHR